MKGLHQLVLTSNAFLFACFAVDSSAQTTPDMIYVPIAPCRIVDTRVNGGPFAARETRYFLTNGAAAQGGGTCTVYAGTIPSALSLNVTVDATSLGDSLQYGFLNLAPTAGAGSSWMNFFGGEIIANAGVATINPLDGSFAIKTQNPANVVIDVYGYWVPSLVQTGSGGEGSVVIGKTSTASGQYSTASGYMTTAAGPFSVAMGGNSKASADSSTALGGGTIASGNGSTALGIYTTASGVGSVAIGSHSTASGDYSTVLGDGNTASGPGSTAMGLNSDTGGHTGSFVYGDGSASGFFGNATTTNTASNQFMARAAGGFVFYTAPADDTTTGVSLAPGSGAWTSLSDRNAKDYVQTVDSRAVLDRVVELPLNTWRYKTQDAKYRHMGPMAQDFYAAFHLGESDTGIDTVDADGVALAAIQGLNAKFNAKIAEKDKEIASLRADLAEIKHQLALIARSQTNDVIVATAPH